MATAQPNIVFFMIDDLGWADLQCYGSTFYETPNLDRLAAEGIRFTDAYASCPVCSPTRASLMSGKAPARVGVTQFIGGHAVGRLCDVPYFHELPLSEISVASALRRGGYQTWHVGKWHLGDRQCWPDRHGFDKNVAGCGWGAPKHGYFSPWRCETLEDGEEGEYLTDRLTDEAINLIRQREKGKPFFLHFAHYAVHTPLQAPESLVEKYRAKAEKLGLRDQDALEEGEYFPCQHKRTLRVMRRKFQSHAVYAAMVEAMDTSIGRVMDELRDQGLDGETLIVFTSDNGGLSTAEGSPTCNAPMAEGKGWMYEGGTRVCQIARWPGVIQPGVETSAVTSTYDWYPTLLEAAGLGLMPEQHVDGQSIMPALKGDKNFDRGPVFWHYPHYGNQGGTPGASVREGEWKLIKFFEDDHLELYNLAKDVSETHDLSVEQPDIAARLHKMLTDWQREVEALIPKPNPNYIAPPLEAGVDPAEV